MFEINDEQRGRKPKGDRGLVATGVEGTRSSAWATKRGAAAAEKSKFKLAQANRFQADEEIAFDGRTAVKFRPISRNDTRPTDEPVADSKWTQ